VAGQLEGDTGGRARGELSQRARAAERDLGIIPFGQRPRRGGAGGTGRRSTRRCSTSPGCWTGRRWREGCGCSCRGALDRGPLAESCTCISYESLRELAGRSCWRTCGTVCWRKWRRRWSRGRSGRASHSAMDSAATAAHLSDVAWVHPRAGRAERCREYRSKNC
jgi:hypothetical protein